MSVLTNQQIFRFNVPIDDLVLVQILQSKQYLNKVESGLLLRHAFYLLEPEKEFSSRTV